MKKTAYICDESFFWHNAGDGALFEPPSRFVQSNGSVESPESKRRLQNLLYRSGLMEHLQKLKPRYATYEELEYFHTKQHIDNVKSLSCGKGGDCGDSAIVGSGSYEIAALSVGAAIVAVEHVVNQNMTNAYALTRPPGHHAESNRGVGFCIFNNAVIATKYAQYNLGIKKIAIIDWDAHHGNGTEDAFIQDDSVLFVSLHQSGLEPIGRGNVQDRGLGRGEGYTVNIPLYAGSGDAAYLYAFNNIVAPQIDKFEPELILISAGQDASIFDPLARMMVSADGYRKMTQIVKSLADKHCQGRIVALHEGGYCPVYAPFCSHAIIEELSNITTQVQDPFIYAMKGTGYNTLLPHQKDSIDQITEYLSGG